MLKNDFFYIFITFYVSFVLVLVVVSRELHALGFGPVTAGPDYTTVYT